MKNKALYISAIILALPALVFAYLFRHNLLFIIPAIFSLNWFAILAFVELIAGFILLYFGIYGLGSRKTYSSLSPRLRIAVILAAVSVFIMLILEALVFWAESTYQF